MILRRAPIAILVHGLPCTGKTTIAREIARQFGLPLFEKDEIKEILFETLGWGDRQRSRELGIASVDILHYLIRVQAAAGQESVVDCNFHPEYDNEKLHKVMDEFPFRSLQILCWSTGDIIVERFQARTGKRHPGHGDDTLIEEIKPMLRQGKAEPLDIGGEIYPLDTSDFSVVNYEALFRWIESRIG